jgi:hypothetical protein
VKKELISVRKISLVILAAAVLLSFAACGETNGADEAVETPEIERSVSETPEAETAPLEETEQAPEVPILIAGKDIQLDDRGEGPVYLESRYGSVYIPEGLGYEIRNIPETVEVGKYDDFQVGLFLDSEYIGGVITVYSRRVSSLEDCIEACINANDYGGTKQATVSEGLLNFGGLDFKTVKLEKPDGSEPFNYLVAYYENDEGTGGCIEVWDYEHGWGEPVRVNDLLVIEMLEKSVFR